MSTTLPHLPLMEFYSFSPTFINIWTSSNLVRGIETIDSDGIKTDSKFIFLIMLQLWTFISSVLFYTFTYLESRPFYAFLWLSGLEQALINFSKPLHKTFLHIFFRGFGKRSVVPCSWRLKYDQTSSVSDQGIKEGNTVCSVHCCILPFGRIL